jgi:AraC-like DNA-binding protein/quercetin dioxygenase-like cupin family protein
LWQIMSKKRQTRFDRVGESRKAIVTLSQDYPTGHKIRTHFHDRDQLVFACRGVMTVSAVKSIWVVPANRAVWIPENVPHSISISGEVAMRTLYFKPRLVKTLPEHCCVVNVSSLFQELILHACKLGTLDIRSEQQRHLVEIIIDQMERIETVPLNLPGLTDLRAKRVAEILVRDPGSQRTFAQISRSCGASKRTVERLFLHETGMTLGRWRQQLRLFAAIRRLAEGDKVTHAALEVGYSTPSAFISAFKKQLGTTPRSYFGRGNAQR